MSTISSAAPVLDDEVDSVEERLGMIETEDGSVALHQLSALFPGKPRAWLLIRLRQLVAEGRAVSTLKRASGSKVAVEHWTLAEGE